MKIKADAGIRAPGQNIVDFAAKRTSHTAVSRGVQAKRRTRKVTISTTDDAQLSEASVKKSFKAFLMAPESNELFGFVLDGNTNGERTSEQADRMERLNTLIATETKQDIGLTGVNNLEFKAAQFDNKKNVHEGPISYFVDMNGAEKPTVYLSESLGFRGSLISANLAYSDYIVEVGRQLGLELMPGDIAPQIDQAVSTGELPNSNQSDALPEKATLDIDGKPRTGIVR